MKILCAGDSFTYGEELADTNNAWPFLLGRLIRQNRNNQVSVFNIAEPAASNDRILRTVLDAIAIDPLIDTVIIGWTSLGRTEFADEVGSYDVWPGYQGNLFLRDGCSWRKELSEYVSKYHSTEWYVRRFYQQVVLLQSYLKLNNIKYLMMDTICNEYYKKKTYGSEIYFTQIDTKNYIDFRTAGMCEWTYGCALGSNGHFLEDGHQQVAERIYDYTWSIGWFS